MRKSTDWNGLAALEEIAPRGVSSHHTPIVIFRHELAGNDATCEDPAVSMADVEPWLQHARAAEDLGDVAFTDTASFARPMIDAVYQAARAHRAFILGNIIIAAIKAAGAFAHRMQARHRQRRQARAICDALHQLDDHMLRDLGLDRSEITSVAAEVTGEAECTRVRALPT